MAKNSDSFSVFSPGRGRKRLRWFGAGAIGSIAIGARVALFQRGGKLWGSKSEEANHRFQGQMMTIHYLVIRDTNHPQFVYSRALGKMRVEAKQQGNKHIIHSIPGRIIALYQKKPRRI